jgi:hypothetical protein
VIRFWKQIKCRESRRADVSYFVGYLAGALIITFLLFRLFIFIVGKLTIGTKVSVIAFVIVLIITSGVTNRSEKFPMVSVLNTLFLVGLLIIELIRKQRKVVG